MGLREYDCTMTRCPICNNRLQKLNPYDTMSKKVCLSEPKHVFTHPERIWI